jgi:LacI family transcriptional regulator
VEHKQAVTIIDVARRARVSAGTVSNVLTGKRPVADRTRSRILAAIEELGYQPNLLARSLVNRATNTLGVVASGLEYYGPSRTLVGIERQAAELGYSLLLSLLHDPQTADVNAVLGELLARRVDGIIWAVHEIGRNRGWIAPERLRNLPPIVFLTMERRPQTAIVSTDNRSGAALAVRHLLEQGRRQIAIITGPMEWWETRERLAGWRTCLDEAGADHGDTLIFHGDWTAASGERAYRHLLARRRSVDAIFACNDQMALGVLRACHFDRRRVPDDLAVAGYDNMPEASYLVPSLTSVRQHLADVGRMAVQELHRAIAARVQGEAPDPLYHLVMPELVVRESSAAAR